MIIIIISSEVVVVVVLASVHQWVKVCDLFPASKCQSVLEQYTKHQLLQAIAFVIDAY